MTSIEGRSPTVVTNSLCNVGPESSQAKKSKRKRKKAKQDAQPGPSGDVSSIKNDSLRGDSCLQSDALSRYKSFMKSGQTSQMAPSTDASSPALTNSSPTKMKNKTRINVQDDVKSDPPGEVSSLKNSSLQTHSCSESAVDVSTKIDSPFSEASEKNTIGPSILPVVTDSVCHAVDVSTKINSQLDQAPGKNTISASKPPVVTDSARDAVDVSTKIDSQLAEASGMDTIGTSPPPVVTESICDAKPESSQVKKRKRKRQKVKQDVESCLESVVDMSTDVGSKAAEASQMTHMDCSIPVVMESLCNMAPESSQAKKSGRRRKKATQDAQPGPSGDVSSIKNDSLRRDSCLQSDALSRYKSFMKSGQTSQTAPSTDASGPALTNSSPTKIKNKTLINMQDDVKSDPPGEVSSLKNSSLQTHSCSESAVDVSTKIDSPFSEASEKNTIGTSILPVVTDSVCHAVDVSTKINSQLDQAPGKNTISASKPPVVTDSARDAVDVSTKIDSQLAEASGMDTIGTSPPPVVTESICDSKPESSQVKKRKRKRQKVKQDVESCLESVVDMSTDVGSKAAEASQMTHMDCSIPVVMESLCNMAPESSQAKKSGRQRKKATQDAQPGPPGDVSSIKNASLQRDSCLKSDVLSRYTLFMKSGQTSGMAPSNDASGPALTNSSPTKMKNKTQKEGHDDEKSDPPGGVSSLKNSSLQRHSCPESTVDVSTNIDSQLDQALRKNTIGTSTLSVVTDSVCDAVDVSTKIDSQLAQALGRDTIGTSPPPVARESICDAKPESSQVNKRKKKRQKVMQDVESCLESVVDSSTDVGSKAAEASQMTHMDCSMPVFTGSLCNMGSEGPQAKKSERKRQKATQDAQPGPPGDVPSIKNNSIRRDSCLKSDASGPVLNSPTKMKNNKTRKKLQYDEKSDPPVEVSSLKNSSLQRDSCSESAADVSTKIDSQLAQASGKNTIDTSTLPVVTDSTCDAVDLSTMIDSQIAKASEMNTIGTNTPPVVTDSICDAKPERSQVKNRKKRRQKATQDVESCVESEVVMSTDVGSKATEASQMSHIENCSMPAVTESLLNAGPESSQAKKSKRKRQKATQDAQPGPSGDVSSIKNNSLPRDSYLSSDVYIRFKLYLKSRQSSEMTPSNGALGPVPTNSSPTKMKNNKRRKMGQVDGRSDAPGDVSTFKNSSLQRESCSESAVDVSTKVDSELAQASGMNTIHTNSRPVVPDHTCNVKFGSSETKNIKGKMRTKKKQELQGLQDLQNDAPGDVSSIKGSSLQRYPSIETDVCTSTKVDLKRGQASETTLVNDSNLEAVPDSLCNIDLRSSQPKKEKKGNVSILIGKNTMISEEHGGSPSSGSSSLMKISDSVSQLDIVSQQHEIVQTFQKDDGSLETYHGTRKLHDALGDCMESTVQTCDGYANVLDVPRVEVHSSSVKDVQDNLDEKGLSLSKGKVGFEENDTMTVTKVNADSSGPIMEENTPQVPHFSAKGSHTRCSNKKLLILDINGLLADIVPPSRSGPMPDIRIAQKYVFKRPFCHDFLQFCLEKFEVGVWSSRTKQNLERAVNYLFGDLKDKLLFCWDQSHCTKTRFHTIENRDKPLVLKELKKLWEHLKSLPGNLGEYDASNTLLLDDSPYKALTNPVNTCLFPRSYSHRSEKDSSIGPGGELRVYLEELAEAPNVSEFIAHKPFGQKAITKSSPSWGFYEKVLRSL